MDMNLRGKRVLVTGASQGIGEGIAEAFAREGCNLVLVARSYEKLTLIAERLSCRFRVDVEVIPLDLADDSAPQHLSDVGEIDVLVNNAGAIPGGAIDQVGPAAWRAGWDLKVFGYINLCRAFLSKMEAMRKGVILNVIGASANYLDPSYIAGSTGNAALVALTRALGARSIESGVRVLGVNPGPVSTDRIKRLVHDGVGFEGDLPMGRPAHVHEVADLVVFLASPRASYLSGIVVDIDGGMSARHAV